MKQIVKGKMIDDETRCVHYHSEQDIIAIKFKCCKTYYPCYYCHEETVDHQPEKWAVKDFDTAAILCGKCKSELPINEYLKCNNQCPVCKSEFNVHCKNHHHFYFDI